MSRPQLDMVYVKDFAWQNGKVANVPLGEGMVGPRFFKMLDEIDFAGPISLHVEYLSHKDPSLIPKHLAAMKNDLATLRGWLR